MSARRSLTVSLAVAWRATHNYLHDPTLLVPSMVFPLFFFAAFAGGLSRINDIPGFHYQSGYTAFQFVYVLLQAVVYGGVFTGVTIAIDLQGGFIRRLLLAAPRRSAIVIGYAIFGVLRGIVPAVVLVAVALISGMRVDGDGVNLVGVAGLALLANVAASLWGLGLAMRLRSAEAAQLLQLLMFLVLFLAPVYVPLGLVSGWVHAVASVNPTTALLQAGRGLVAGRPAAVATAFAAVGGCALLLSAWALGGLRRVERAG